MCIIGEDPIDAAEAEERLTHSTDATVQRAYQRAVDAQGSASADDHRVMRHMRKLARSLAMRNQQLVRNQYGQLILAKTCSCETTGKRGCSAHVIRPIKYEATDRDTGEIRTVRKYRIGYYQGGSGFVFVNDGARTGRDLQRILDKRSRWTTAA
jgi:hypothetical protein